MLTGQESSTSYLFFLPSAKPAEVVEVDLTTAERIRICPQCLKRCNEKHFARHLKTHDKEATKEKCDMCGKVVGRGDNLKRHKKERCQR